MTLHEAAAVYLIIGAVMMGPIEGQDLSNINAVHDCVRAHGIEPGTPMVAAPESCPRITVARETTAETCARAMREIGATKQTPIDFFGRETPDEKKALRNWKAGDPYVFRWYLAGQRIYCISAPSGLVR